LEEVYVYINGLIEVIKTFKYTEQGPVGLLTNKKALHIQALKEL
jgi:FMN-dependent NADH-azoreductase